jgi:chitodextrinase
MTARIYSPPNASTYTTISSFSNLNATTGWVLTPQYDVSAFKGQTIRLQFSATTDSTLFTDFFLDNVTLMVSGATPDTQPPTVPTGLTATAISASAINLGWTASTDNVGVTAYKLYRNGTLLATLGNVTNYGDTGLAAGTAYSYTVSACDAGGNCSAESTAVFATTNSAYYQATPIVFVGPSTVQVNGSLVNITINTIRNQSSTLTSGSLRIDFWAMNAPFSYGGSALGYVTASIRTALVSGLSDRLAPNASFSGITLNLPYTAPPAGYTNKVLFLMQYDSVNCTTGDHFCVIDYVNYHEATSPTVPTGLITTAVSSSQINLAWTAATDNVGVATYKVYRSGTLVALLGNVTSYSDIGLTASTTYSYTVSACDAAGNCSAQSTAASATTPALPDVQSPTVPTGLTATAVSSTQINLTWKASTDNASVTAYKIYSSGNLVATLGNVTSTSRTVAASTTYQYTASACDAAGNCSAQSAAASATTPAPSDTQSPSVPTGLTATLIGGNAINLAWTAATDNVGVATYKLYRNGTLSATLGNVTSYGDTALRDSTTYSYTVSACDAAGNCSAQSTGATAATPAISTATLNFVAGWNLAGNSSSGALDVVTAFGDANKVSTVWKWVVGGAKWAFYAPSLVGQALTDYATGKGYDVLTTINGGEGFWVNAKTAFTAQLPAGTAVTSTSFQSMASGWNLIAIGDNKTPSEFNALVGAATPLTTLWAWDATLANWYFYAPSLEAKGGTTLTDYITSKGYLDFTTNNKTLGSGMGFWVNKP